MRDKFNANAGQGCSKFVSTRIAPIHQTPARPPSAQPPRPSTVRRPISFIHSLLQYTGLSPIPSNELSSPSHQHRVIYEDTVTIDNTIKSTIQTVHRPIDLLLVLGQKIILFFPLPHYNYKLSSICPFPLECKSH